MSKINRINRRQFLQYSSLTLGSGIVAAIFQKDPLVLIAHPNTGVKTLEDLKGKPIFVSAAANTTYWPFLKAKYTCRIE